MSLLLELSLAWVGIAPIVAVVVGQGIRLADDRAKVAPSGPVCRATTLPCCFSCPGDVCELVDLRGAREARS